VARVKDIPKQAKLRVERARARSGPVDIAMSTFKSFSLDDGGVYSAALTYYIFFSIFPLLLFAAAVLGYVADDPARRADILNAGVDAFPLIRQALAPDVLDNVSENASSYALLGLVLALYSGTGVVVALGHALHKMYGVADEGSFFAKRLDALKWLALLGTVALLSIGLGAAAGYSEKIFDSFGTLANLLSFLVAHLAGFITGIILFGAAYKFLSGANPSWREVLPGAIAAALAFEVLKEVGAWYLERGAESRKAAFGTMAAAAGLLVASYLVSQITLLAAELNAVVAERRHRRESFGQGGVMAQGNPGDGGIMADSNPSNEARTTQLYYSGDGRSGKSSGQLVKEISEDMSTLIRKEIELAKQELGSSISAKIIGAVIFAIVGVLGVFALIFFMIAVRDALSGPLSEWAADLITAGILLAVGLIAGLVAKSKLSTPISTELTKETIKEDIEWAKTLGKR